MSCNSDFKSILNQICQQNHLPTPRYMSDRTGEDHCPIFTSTVIVNGKKYVGKPAGSKKESERNAAERALRNKSFLPTDSIVNGNDTTKNTQHNSAEMSPPRASAGVVSYKPRRKVITIDTDECIMIDMENIQNGMDYEGDKVIHFTSRGHPLEKYANTIIESRYSDAVDVAIIMETTRLIDLDHKVAIVSKDRIFLPLLDLGKGLVRILPSMDEFNK